MSREESKKAAKELLDLCAKEGVKVPTDLRNAMVQAGTMLNATREDGKFQMKKALQEMINKFGQTAPSTATKKRKASEMKDTKSEPKRKASASKVSNKENVKDEEEDTKKSTKKPSKARSKKVSKRIDDDDDDDDDEEDEEDKPKKPVKRSKPTATCDENQQLAEAFSELAGFEFKRGERFKGGTWSKVAKAIRDSEAPITSGKQALKLKGIGKSSAAKIDEFLESGTLKSLEEFRAGNM